MKAVSQTYKDNIKELGKEIDAYITYTLNGVTHTLDSEIINSVSKHYDGGILQSVMQQLDIEATEDIPIGTEVNCQFGVKVDEDNYEYVDFGDFIIYSSEKQEDSNSYKIIAYDKIINSMKDYLATFGYVLTTDEIFDEDKKYYEYDQDYEEYTGSIYFLTEDETFIEDKRYFEYVDNEYEVYDGDTTGDPSALGLYELGNPSALGLYEYKYVPLPFPMTVREYITLICSKLGLTFENENDTFPNYDKEIQNELYLDTEGNEIGFTYRDILDQLAQVTASTICINNNGNLELRYINDTNSTIDAEYLKDINVNFGEVIDPINTITFRRSEADEISLSYPEDLPNDQKREIIISDNQILNFDNRDEYLQDILDELYGLTYTLNDFTSTGITFYELCDRYEVSITKRDDEDNIIETSTYPCIMLNDEINISQGLEEIVHTERGEETPTDFNTTTKTDRLQKRTNLVVNKQEGYIEAITGELGMVDGESQVINGIVTKQTQNALDIEAITSYEMIDGKETLTGVKTRTGFTFNSKGLIIQSSENTYRAVHNETGEYYYDGEEILGTTNPNRSAYKNMEIYGEFRYGMDEITDNPMFIDMLYEDEDGEGCVGTFYNGS